MKKTYRSILFALIAAAGFTACSDYEAPDITTESAISITGHETYFPASASTGSITFEAKGPVTVTTDNEWITTTLDGNTINIAVTQNNALDGRTGTIIVKCGNATDEISIIQSGIIFKFADVSEIDIESKAWTNSYEANASIPMSVTSDSEWLKASLTDGILTIEADRNTKLQARTGIVTISVGNLTYDITVNQGPLIFPLVKATEISQNDDAKTYTYDFPSDIEVTFSSDVEWLHGSFENETVTITVDANNDGHIRKGNLSYSLEGTEGSVSIEQYQFDKDIAGEYILVYTNSAGKQAAFKASLKQTGTKYSIDLTDLDFSIPVQYDETTLTLKLGCGDYIGNWVDEDGTFSVYSIYGFVKDGKSMVTASENAYMTSQISYSEMNGKGYTIASFKDSGTYDYPLNSFILAGFSTSEFDFDGYEFNLLVMRNIQLQKTHALSSESTSQNTPSTKIYNSSLSKIQTTLSKDSNIYAY
ncbi:BACON domain-containing carbohydrate-binding protein [Duncaniella sp.]|uniref:BACON domain-containing protein n=1 Tax=Duncaniella sp. TaxID=2518496 RepID=UPI0023D524B5|nr:BACON domain-containing carbohydrate-binding protein [Duncaniella sp.]MDE5903733.1 hypothetical protein [Duncaniella sp.]